MLRTTLALTLLLAACGRPDHEPMLATIGGTVLDLQNGAVPLTEDYWSRTATPTVTLLDIGLVFVGLDVPPLGAAELATDGTFEVPDVDVSQMGVQSPVLSLVEDGGAALFPTLSGVAGARADVEAGYDATVFAGQLLLVQLVEGVVAGAGGPRDLRARGFIFGLVLDGEQHPVAGAVVHTQDVVEGLVYLEIAGGLPRRYALEETSALGAFVAWYRDGVELAAAASDTASFVIEADSPGAHHRGVAFAMPGTMFVGAILQQ